MINFVNGSSLIAHFNLWTPVLISQDCDSRCPESSSLQAGSAPDIRDAPEWSHIKSAGLARSHRCKFYTTFKRREQKSGNASRIWSCSQTSQRCRFLIEEAKVQLSQFDCTSAQAVQSALQINQHTELTRPSCWGILAMSIPFLMVSSIKLIWKQTERRLYVHLDKCCGIFIAWGAVLPCSSEIGFFTFNDLSMNSLTEHVFVFRYRQCSRHNKEFTIMRRNKYR